MKPTSFKETNQVLLAGNNPNTDQLPICHAINDSMPNVNFVISKWKLSQEELDEVNRTGCVWVSVMGQTQPPVFIAGENIFDVYGYKPREI